jgi:hypothetical protein
MLLLLLANLSLGVHLRGAMFRERVLHGVALLLMLLLLCHNGWMVIVDVIGIVLDIAYFSSSIYSVSSCTNTGSYPVGRRSWYLALRIQMIVQAHSHLMMLRSDISHLIQIERWSYQRTRHYRDHSLIQTPSNLPLASVLLVYG